MCIYRYNKWHGYFCQFKNTDFNLQIVKPDQRLFCTCRCERYCTLAFLLPQHTLHMWLRSDSVAFRLAVTYILHLKKARSGVQANKQRVFFPYLLMKPARNLIRQQEGASLRNRHGGFLDAYLRIVAEPRRAHVTELSVLHSRDKGKEMLHDSLTCLKACRCWMRFEFIYKCPC